jgi:predicted KAP-like P-loop ATPase
MWTDNETERDFLNFSGIATTVAEVIRQAQPSPVSVGVSGAWGVGKSSLIKLIKNELSIAQSAPRGMLATANTYVFVEFNAWLYQGYDDARAALLDTVASTLAKEADARKKGTEKAWEFVERVNLLRLAKMASSAAAVIAAAHPVIALAGTLVGAATKVVEAAGTQSDATKKEKGEGSPSHEETERLIKPKKAESPPKEIQALRDTFEDALQAMEVTLVVLIDDLDRCLPETAVSTLEAIRLLLFLPHTAFVIAADEAMIKHAVRRHFEGVEDALVTNYFDKLIQVPIRVPQLGVQEVRAYLMMLFIEDSALDGTQKEELRQKICGQLGRSWQGKRVDLAFVKSLGIELPTELVGRLDTADRLAPIMAKASGISGNPRLIKRFLNAISIRLSLARSQGVGVDESVLTKMILFERCGNAKAYEELIRSVSQSDAGHPVLIQKWEADARSGSKLELPANWDPTFTTEWLRLDPTLGDRDLRGVLYVGREYAPLLLPEDRLSSTSLDLLNALLTHPEVAASLKDQFKQMPPPELAICMDKVLDKARLEQEWGVPPILDACILIAGVDSTQAARLAAFLKERPGSQIKASIVPKIGDCDWAKTVLQGWSSDNAVGAPVKSAIKLRGADGNIAVK